MTRGISEAGTD